MNNKTTSKLTLLFYLITPVVLMVVFMVYFKNHQAQQDKITQEKQRTDMEIKRLADQKKAEVEEQLKDEAERLAKARAEAAFREEKENEEKRQKEIDRLSGLISRVQGNIATFDTEIAKFNGQIKTEREKRKGLEEEVWNRARENENIRVTKNTNDLESQRLTDMIVNRVTGEWSRQLAVQPLPVVPAKK